MTALTTMFKSKIHRCVVTEADLNYIGSITIDQNLIDAANMMAHERVQIVNCNNGERLETYIIPGPRGSGKICLNGAAARKVAVGDIVIIIGYAQVPLDEAAEFSATTILVDEKNVLTETIVAKPGGIVHQ